MDKYKSKTKGSIPIEKMHTKHILNAIKKVSKLSTYDPVMKAKLLAELSKRSRNEKAKEKENNNNC